MLIPYGKSLCPIERTNVKYIMQSGAGNSTGGGGSGTFGSPWLCNTVNDLFTLLAAQQAADTRFRINETSVFRISSGSPGASCTLTADNMTIDTYSSASGSPTKTCRKFTLRGSITLATTGWATADSLGGDYAGATKVYYKACDASFRYLMLQGSRGLSHPFKRYAATATPAATVQTMHGENKLAFVFDSANNRVFVRMDDGVITGLVGAPKWNTANIAFEQLLATTDAFIFTGDGCRVDGMKSIGFGMNEANSNNYHIRFDPSSSVKMLGVSNCEIYYGGYHMIGSLQSGGSQPGALMWVDGLDIGFNVVNNVGTSTQFVSYANGGGNEYVLRNVRGRAGALETEKNSYNAIQSDITTGHSAGGASFIALAVTIGCGVDTDALLKNTQSTGYSLGLLAGEAPATFTTGGRDTTQYRSWEYDTRSDGGGAPVNGVPTVKTNCITTARFSSAATAVYVLTTQNPPRVLMMNSVLEMFFTSRAEWPGLETTIFQPSGTGFHHMVHSGIILSTTVSPPGNESDIIATMTNGNTTYQSRLSDSEWWNSFFFASQHQVTLSETNLWNAGISSGGGCEGLVVYAENARKSNSGNIKGYDNVPGYIEVSSPMSSAQMTSTPLTNLLGVAIRTASFKLEFDINYRRRNTLSTPGLLAGENWGVSGSEDTKVVYFPIR